MGLGTQLQGDHGGQRLGFVKIDLVVPLSAPFWLGQLQIGQKLQSSVVTLWNLKNIGNKM